MSEVTVPAIVRAEPADAKAVRTVLAAAFHDGDLAPWLVADPDERARIYPDYFLMLAEHALEHSIVETTEDGLAVAVWHAMGERPRPTIPEYDGRLAAVTRPYAARFVALDEAMERHHPADRPHHYLAFLAVHPGAQSKGYGSHLLRHHHAQLDAAGIPAYLEATGLRNERLYLQHGYLPGRAYPVSRNGPMLYPMWRQPFAIGPRTRLVSPP